MNNISKKPRKNAIDKEKPMTTPVRRIVSCLLGQLTRPSSSFDSKMYDLILENMPILFVSRANN